MHWRYYHVELRLTSPLHVGFHPVSPHTSVVSRTRLYVPARAVWGAVTNSLTRRLHTQPAPNDFQQIGPRLRDECRFSYLFPEVEGKGVLQPRWKDEGLLLGDMRQEAAATLLLDSLTSTGITRGEHRADDNTLHEMEFIMPRVRPGGRVESVPVHLVGGLWVREGGDVGGNPPAHCGQPLFDDLRLGGERTSGWGCVDVVSVSQADPPPEWQVNDGAGPVWTPSQDDPFLPAHCVCKALQLARGEWEALASRQWRDNGGQVGDERKAWGYCWTPGTKAEEAVRLVLTDNGTLSGT